MTYNSFAQAHAPQAEGRMRACKVLGGTAKNMRRQKPAKGAGKKRPIEKQKEISALPAPKEHERREKARLRSERWRLAHGIGPRKPAARPWLAMGVSRSTGRRPASKPLWPPQWRRAKQSSTGSIGSYQNCARRLIGWPKRTLRWPHS
jgi:hypothetical protein